MVLRRWRSSTALVGLFLVLSLIKIARHEMWADELEYWDAARESHSLAELRHNTLYIGQPPLGHLVFYALSRFTRDPRALQILNVVVVTAAIGVVGLRAPWSPLASWLFAFGYFPFFEYGTISRPYGLGLLLAVILCAAFARQSRPTPALGAVGLLLALCNFHSTLIVLALLIASLCLWGWERRRPDRGELVAATLLAFGVVVSVCLAIPPRDAVSLKPWRLDWRAPDAILAAGQLWNGYVPLPALEPPFWNHNLLDAAPGAKLILGLVLFAWFALALRRFVLPLVLFVAGTLGLVLFGYAQWGGFVRHAGLLYLVLIMSLWMAAIRPRLFTLLLLAQLPGALFMSYKDLVLPFSASAATADYLRDPKLAKLPIVGHEEFLVAPVATLLDRPFYAVASRRWTTRVEFGPRLRPVDEAAILQAVRFVQVRKQSDVLLVINGQIRPRPRIRLLSCFSEDFTGQKLCIYRAAGRPVRPKTKRTGGGARVRSPKLAVSPAGQALLEEG